MAAILKEVAKLNIELACLVEEEQFLNRLVTNMTSKLQELKEKKVENSQVC